MSEPTNPTSPEAASAPAVAPAAPAKPAAAAPAKPAKPARRSFLFTMFATWWGVAWATMTLSGTAMALGTVRFLFPNVLSEPPSKFKVGDKSQFEDGKVDTRFKDQGTWIVRARDDKGQDIIVALSTTCTHLGCTPNWLEAEKKFKCPCHGSGFQITGVNFEGPAPRPLERWGLSVAEDGQLLVDKSKKFQKELGQWGNPESYVPA